MTRVFRFETVWHLAAERQEVWRLVAEGDPVQLTPWWRGVTLAVGPEGLVEGGHATLSVRSPVGYVLTAQLWMRMVVKPGLLTAESAGDLVGTGRIELMPSPDREPGLAGVGAGAGGALGALGAEHRGRGGGEAVTVVRVIWEVAPTKRWMRLSAWLLSPLFRWAHARVMANGERGLRRALATRG